MKIEIVTTPNQQLKETGFGTLDACHSLLVAITNMGFAVKLNVCETKEDLDAIVKRNPDLVVLAVKYIPTENNDDIWLADYFMQHEINFTGSAREALKFDSNKILAKSYLMNKGISTAKYFTSVPGKYKRESDLPIQFPLFLKPISAANGNGIDDLSLVNNFLEYENKILSLYNTFKQPVLVEEYLDGREFTAAIIRTANNKLIISAIEIVPPISSNGLRILGEKVKNDNSEKLIAIEDNEIKNRIEQLSADVFCTLGARDFGRIDIKANKAGQYFFVEANLVPGMTAGSSYFPRAFEIASDLNYNKVVQLMLEKGLSRANSMASNRNTVLNQNSVALN
ncbi:MAG: hypothetical protein QM484_15610 [Woeseiaceae bacterium]